MLRKILIVDDSRVDREILRKILSGEYETLEAENGREALALLRRDPEDISAVVLDLVMPECDGYETLSAIKNDRRLSGIPVIVATGCGKDDVEVKALSLGAIDFTVKPYNPTVIRHKLFNTIRLRETAAIINTAERDKLTGLYNRETFFEKAAARIAGSAPGTYVLSCFDVDNFKVINDQFGSDVGDSALQFIAETLSECFLEIDGVCSRIMADHFAVLYPAAYVGSERIERARQRAAELDGMAPAVSFSIGRYRVDDPALPVSAMYDRAVIAKSSVKGRFDVHAAAYDERMRERLLRQQEIISEMKGALSSGQFVVYFQPEYNHSSGALIGAEALVRWQHPKRGMIPPNDFVPLFERNGFIYEMDKYVWEESCRLLRKWLDLGSAPLPLSVNVSRYDVFQPDFFDTITGLLEKYELPISLLRVEITESAFAKSTHQIISVVRRLIDFGFSVEIDDFGSGYSSLNTLKDVPASILKLDMRFLEGDENSQRGGNILESVVRMAKWLGMQVIAEGVETIAQADYLRSIGCFYVQGYLYARPIPAHAYEKLLANCDKEDTLYALETLETLDNNAFWDPKSMETLIFNSYVGGACIFEYNDGRTELLRVNRTYAAELFGVDAPMQTAMGVELADFMDAENREKFFSNIERAVDTAAESACEVKLTAFLHQSACAFLSITVRLLAKTGGRSLLYGAVRNVTAQREAERKEQEISRQMQSIMENVNGGVCAVIVDAPGTVHFIFANERYFSMFGYTREQLETEHPDAFELVYPEDRPRIREEIVRVLSERTTTAYEYRCQKRNGELIYVRCNASVTSIEGVGDDVLLSVITDITELVDAERKLRLTSERLQTIMDNINGGVTATVMRQGVPEILFANDQYFLQLGYTREQFAREVQNPFQLVHPDDRADVEKRTVEASASRLPFTCAYRTLRRDGSMRWMQSKISVTEFPSIAEPVQLSVANDITAEKLSAERIAEAYGQLSFLNTVSNGLLSTEDADTAIHEVLSKVLQYFDGNRAYVFEIDWEKKISDNTYELCAPGVTSERDMLRAVPLGAMDFWLHAFDRRNHVSIRDVGALDGERESEREILRSQSISSLIAVPLRRDGKLIGFMGVDDPKCKQDQVSHLEALGDYMTVVLTRRDLSAKIESDNRTLRELMNDTPGGFVRMRVYSPEHIVPVYMNDGFLNFVSMTLPEAMHLYENDAKAGVHPDDVPIVAAAIDEMLSTGETQNIRYRLITGGGSYMYFTIYGRTSKNSAGETFLNIYYADAAEEMGREEMEKALLDNLPCGAGVYEVDGSRVNVLHLNKRYTELVGRKPIGAGRGSQLASLYPGEREKLMEAFFAARREQRDMQSDIHILHGDGTYRPFQFVGKLRPWEGGRTLVYATLTPISDEEMEAKRMLPIILASMMESSAELSIVKDKNFQYICCSRAFARMAGLSSEKDIAGKTDFDLFERGFAEKYRRDDERIIKTGKPMINIIESLPSRGDDMFYCCTSKYPLHDSQGNVIGIYCTGRRVAEDGTEEDGLNRAQFYQSILDNSIPVGTVILEIRGNRLLHIGGTMLDELGYTEEEFQAFQNVRLRGFVLDEDYGTAFVDRCGIKEAYEPVFSQEYRVKKKDGSVAWLYEKGTLVSLSDGAPAYVIAYLDVTDRKEMEERLRISEEELRLSMAKMGKMVFLFDAVTRTLTMPEAFANSYGVPAVLEGVPNEERTRKMFTEEGQRSYLAFCARIAAGEKTGAGEWRTLRADGEWRWQRAEFVTVFSANKPAKVIVTVEDVTEQRRKEDETEVLRENERIFRMVAAHSNRLIYRYDVQTGSVSADGSGAVRAGAFLTDGGLPESVIARGDVLPESVSDYREIFRRIQTGVPEGSAHVRLRQRGGTARWMDMRYTIVSYSGGKPKTAVLSFQDITDIHEMELAYERYLMEINSDAADGRLLYFETDLTADVIERRGGNIESKYLPSTGGSREDAVKSSIQKMVSRDMREKALSFFDRERLLGAFKSGVRTLSEDWLVSISEDAEPLWFSSEIQMLEDPYSGNVKAYTVLRDVTNEKRAALNVRKLAETDGMTGLYNKVTTEAEIEKRLAASVGRRCMLLVADVDNLKSINDTYGHALGDEAIRQAAEALQGQFRTTDVVGRIGGDEFIVFMENGGSEARLRAMMVSLMRRLAEIRLGEEGIYLNCSIGVAMGETGESDFASLYRNADKALYHVKRNGKNDYAFYKPEMEQATYRFPGHDVTSLWRTDALDRVDLDRLLFAMSAIYPTMISVDLAQNSFDPMQCCDGAAIPCFAAGTFDEWVLLAAEEFHPEDGERFREAFARDALCAANKRGERSVGWTGRRRGDDGAYRTVCIQMVFMPSQGGGNVTGILLGRGVGAEN